MGTNQQKVVVFGFCSEVLENRLLGSWGDIEKLLYSLNERMMKKEREEGEKNKL